MKGNIIANFGKYEYFYGSLNLWWGGDSQVVTSSKEVFVKSQYTVILGGCPKGKSVNNNCGWTRNKLSFLLKAKLPELLRVIYTVKGAIGHKDKDSGSAVLLF